MKEKKIIKISFEENPPYEANKFLAEMESFLMDFPTEIEIKREKSDHSTMDLGTILMIILNSAAAVVIAKGIYALLKKYKGVKIKIYSPKPSIDSSYKENEHSLVTFLFYAGHKILLSGDNGPSAWQYLLNNHYFRDDLRNIDIFLASHHGRMSGYYNQIFKFFNPKLTIISDGRSQDTSITDIYNSHTLGWYIQNQNKKRKCLTTRYDGAIYLKISYNSHSYPYLHVRTQYN